MTHRKALVQAKAASLLISDGNFFAKRINAK
jgi:hypothetical protein